MKKSGICQKSRFSRSKSQKSSNPNIWNTVSGQGHFETCICPFKTTPHFVQMNATAIVYEFQPIIEFFDAKHGLEEKDDCDMLHLRNVKIQMDMLESAKQEIGGKHKRGSKED